MEAQSHSVVFPHFRSSVEPRLDQVTMDNQDLLRPVSSFSRNATINSPKGTLTFLPSESTRFLPTVSLSYGQTFHVDDPRIGTTAIQGGTIVAKAHSFQLVASKTVAKTEFRLTMAQVTTAQQLARISNDTGLQQDEGPGIVKYLTFTVRHNFPHGFVQGLFSKTDARDRITGLPTPEAPRQISYLFQSIHVTFLSFVDTYYESLRFQEESSISVLGPDPCGLFEEALWQRSLLQESNLQTRSLLRRGGIRHCSSHYF